MDEGLVLASGSGITFPGTVSSNAVDIYRFQAVADIEVTMSVTLVAGDAALTIYDPENSPLLQADGGGSYTTTIPADGRYLIAVQAGDGDITYEVSVSVK